MNKDILRESMRKKRRLLPPDFIQQSSDKIKDTVLSLKDIKNAQLIMVYLSAFKEPDTFNLISELLDSGKEICVPITDMDTFTITPARLVSLDNLTRGAYGISEPKEFISVPTSEIDVALIPGIAFTASGDRLGFGKGYYDRFLKNFNGTKIGIGYDFQITDKIPSDEHDIGMDMIITEKRLYNDF